MHRLPSLPKPPSSRHVCIRCLVRRQISPPLRRPSAFLASTRSVNPPSQTPEVSPRRNLSQLAGVDSVFSPPAWNSLMSPTPSSDNGLLPAFQPVNQDVLDKIFERWQPTRIEEGLISPTLDSSDPEGIQKYLIQGSSIPQNTVELLTVLDALIDQDDLPRAATVLASLKRVLDPSTPLSTLVYNKYMEGIVAATLQKNAGVGKAMDWFREMVDNGVKADRTTFALLSKAAFSLNSVMDGNRAARKVFGLWRSQGGDVGDLLCDIMFPQEEILRSLKVYSLDFMQLIPVKQNVNGRSGGLIPHCPRTRRENSPSNPDRSSRYPTFPSRYTRRSPNAIEITKSCIYAEIPRMSTQRRQVLRGENL
jgi:hypothetical protein